MYPGVEFRPDGYVVVLAEKLNFPRAALRLHVAQPSLSKHIRGLEDYLGAQVFERPKREVRLTTAGEAFAAEARLTLLHADRAIVGARAAKAQHKGPWSIGSSPLIDLRILSKVRRHLSLEHPAVSAGAKIPIVPFEFSPPLDVVNRSPLQTEEVPKLVKGERRARTKRTATARNEHPGDQQVDWLGSQDDSQVCTGGGGGAGVRPTVSTAEQARCV